MITKRKNEKKIGQLKEKDSKEKKDDIEKKRRNRIIKR